MLSQFCRQCKGNYAGYIEYIQSFHGATRALLLGVSYLFVLTIRARTGILARRTFPSQESIMSDEKLRALHESHTLHPHPSGCAIPSLPVDRPSLTQVTWCKSNMNSCGGCVWMAIPSRMRLRCLRSPAQPFTPHSPPGNRLGSAACFLSPPVRTKHTN